MKNKTLALKALAQDCKIKGRYVMGNKTCAIGCLALLAGIPRKFFTVTVKGLNGCSIENRGLKPVADAIREKFGLTRTQQGNIQSMNDTYKSLADRREHVLMVVKSYKDHA